MRQRARTSRIVVVTAVAGLAALTGFGWSAAVDGTQLIRSPRAGITGVAASHEPLARGAMVRIAVEVEVMTGMHVNANPPTYDWLIPVEVGLQGVAGVGVVEAFYPEALSRKFPYDPEPFLVYEGRFVVGLLVAVDDSAALGAHQLEMVLDYQACNDEACFAPTQAKLLLPVTIVADPSNSSEVSSPLLERAPFPKS